MEDARQENNAMFTAKSVLVDGNDLWMLTEDTDVLLHFDFKSLKLLDYHILPGEKRIPVAHLGLRKCGDIIYIAPYMESSFIFLNCVSGEMGDISIPYEVGEAGKKRKFCIAAVWKSQLVLVGHGVRGIFYYDTIAGSFTRDIGYLNELKKVGNGCPDLPFSDCYCQKRNKLYIPVYCKNIVLEIDMDKRTNEIYVLQHEKEIRLRTIDVYEQDGDEKFLLTTADDEMLIWSPMDGVEKMRSLGLLCGGEKIYMRAFHVKKKNYYIAAYERKVFVESEDGIRELEFEYEKRGGSAETVGDIQGYIQFEAVFKNGTDIYFQARSNGQLFRIDTATDTVHRMDFDVSPEKREEITDRVCSSRWDVDMIMENAGFGLDGFLKKYVCREAKV